MPRKLTIGNERGTENIWGHNAAFGVAAREAKSGAFLFRHPRVKNQTQSKREGIHVTRVAMLLMHDIRPTSIDQLSSEPWSVEGRDTIGPTPLALTIHHTKKVIPAMGVTMAFKVNK